ncbi:MAG: hypothetical protein A7315_05655 [Candidatus Altiarchaeales archaeon WOR_SM1_79]|nr:MAG: hypothetical protein A7315_05655 [Candidatus Altiarchaeales archaeon WOR_SM1_79]
MNAYDIERVETGIPGLDELMGKGIPRGNSVILSGCAGSGKTTFGVQFLVNGIKNDEPGIFVSLEEYLPNIKRNMLKFGWNLAYLQEENKLRLMRLDMSEFGSSSSGNMDIGMFSDAVFPAIKEINAERVVIDPISVIRLMYKSDFKFRVDMSGLQQSLRELNCTTIMVLDAVSGFMSRYNVEEFVSQGVIIFHYIKRSYTRMRGLEIWKMQGTKHSENVHSMEIAHSGLRVYSGVPVSL